MILERLPLAVFRPCNAPLPVPPCCFTPIRNNWTFKIWNFLEYVKKKTKKTVPDSEQRYFLSLAEDLSRRFGTKVQIKRYGQQGTVEIKFYGDNDLDRVISLLNKA